MLRSNSLYGHLHMGHASFQTDLLHMVGLVTEHLHRRAESQGASAVQISRMFASRSWDDHTG